MIGISAKPPKGLPHYFRCQAWTIGADDNHPLGSRLKGLLKGLLQTKAQIPAALTVKVQIRAQPDFHKGFVPSLETDLNHLRTSGGKNPELVHCPLCHQPVQFTRAFRTEGRYKAGLDLAGFRIAGKKNQPARISV